MPLTPFHWGYLLPTGLIRPAFLFLPAFLIAGVLADLEGLYLILTGLGVANTVELLQSGGVGAVFLAARAIDNHAFFHTFLGGTVIGVATAVVVWKSRKIWQAGMRLLRLPRDISPASVLAGGVLGGWSHVLLDSFANTDIEPFWPFSFNPFFGLLGNFELIVLSLLGFLLALPLYFYAMHATAAKN